MKSLAKKLLVGVAGLALATSVPLAASAQQTWHDNGNHGGYRDRDHRGDVRHETFVRGGERTVVYSRPVYRPIYRPVYENGYYGWAPGGFQGYFWNGGWYHHRRWNAGIWIYF